MAGRALSSGLLGAGTTTIYTGVNCVSGVVCISDSTNNATVTVYDNIAASGLIVAKLTATINTGANSIAFITPIRCDVGITVQVTGTGAPTAIVYFGA